MADNRGDGSVSIVVNMDAKDAEKELARLKQKAFKLEEELTVGGSKKSALTAELEQAQKALEELQSQTKIVGNKFVTSPENAKKITAMQEKIQHAHAAVEKQNEALRNTQLELDGVKTRYGEVAQKAQEASGAGNIGGNGDGEQADVEAQGSRMQEVLARLTDGFKNLMSAAASAGKSILKTVGSAALNGLKKLGNLAVKAGNGFLSLFKSTSKTNGVFGIGLKKMLMYSLGIRSLYSVFSKLRSAITDGFKNLAQYSDSTNKSLSNLKSALTQLKNALATAFAPILQTIEPILTRFINMLAKAADYVARFTAALTGKTTYTRATKVQEGYAASLEGTGEAAEEATKSLASFDEINKLAAKDSSSGGGGGGASAGDMFETVPVDALEFDSWGEAFSALLDKILEEGIPKLRKALSALADWINEFFANLYEMFTFPGVLEKVSLIGRELADAFNDFVNQIHWDVIGAALGAGLNLALALMVNFIYEFDWRNLGAKIAELLNNAIAEIDWYNFGKLLWAKFKIAWDMLIGFILNLDATEIANALGETVMGVLDSITEWIYSYNWGEVGQTVYQKIKGLVTGIDYTGIADSFFEALGAALGGLSALLWGIISDAWNDVVDWWHDVAYEDGHFTIEGLLDGIRDALNSIGQWINEHIFQPILTGFQKAFGIASPSKVMKEQGGFIITGLLEGLKAGVQPIITLFTTLRDTVKNILQGITTFLKGVFTADWKTAWAGIQNVFKSIWNGIIGVLESAINAIISGINWMISKLNTIQISTPSWVPFIGGKTYSINIPLASKVSLPRLATGAVIPPNREFLAVLGDQSSGNNIEAPESLIRKIVREETQSNNSDALLREILNAIREGKVMTVDGVQFAKVTKRSLSNASRAAGTPLTVR